MIILTTVFFLLWCNFLPPLSNLIFGNRFNIPVDFNKKFIDKKPIFGAHKTFRGIIIAVMGGTLWFPLMKTSWQVAFFAAIISMAGDLLSSFIKRRFQMESGKSAPILDQFFEGTFPLIYFYYYLPLSLDKIIIVLMFFLPITYAGSWIWRYLVFRPSPGKYPRLIQSAVKVREWRACHQPLARWQKWFNFENYFYHRIFMTKFFRWFGLYTQGLNNALDLQVKKISYSFPALPRVFNEFHILFLTDLHLDGLKGLTKEIIKKIKNLEVDLCIIGGDLRMELYGTFDPTLMHLRELLKYVRAKHGTVGVLGNHDCIEMVPELEKIGIHMLINDSKNILINGKKIWLVGIDDPHYYKVHDLELAFHDVPKDGYDFKIFISHSPEVFKEASRFKPELFLCGHTHGGQICLPDGTPFFTNSNAPRKFARGKWKYNEMLGYTSSGVGSSGVPLRFNCPPEITLITLKKE